MPRIAFALLALSGLAACASDPPPQMPVRPTGPSGGLFISPMGEPFHAAEAGSDLIGIWFAAADADRDGFLTVAEMQTDGARFFRTLDTNGDGQITPPEMVRYEREVAPEIQIGSQMQRGGPGMRGRPGAGGEPGGPSDPAGREAPQQFLLDRDGPPDRRQVRLPQGAARYALLDLPQPVAAADADFNRAVDAEEFAAAAAERFAELDRDRDGRITRQELEPVPVAPVPARSN